MITDRDKTVQNGPVSGFHLFVSIVTPLSRNIMLLKPSRDRYNKYDIWTKMFLVNQNISAYIITILSLVVCNLFINIQERKNLARNR